MGSFIEGCACNNCSKDQVKGDDESDSESMTENEPKDLGIKSRREIPKNIVDVKFKTDSLVKAYDCNPFEFYKELEELGEGAYGVVKKVCLIENPETIRAMKIISKDNILEGQSQQLLDEINILRKLEHPNIMKIYEYFDYKNNIYIVSELCDDGDLLGKMKKLGSMSEVVVKFLMDQILNAISYLHENRIFHGDIKLENVMLYKTTGKNTRRFTRLIKDLNASTKLRNQIENLFNKEKDSITDPSMMYVEDMTNYEVKLIDFGCSKFLHKKKHNKLSGIVGTSIYCSPEVIDNLYDERSDEWSCGVLMYILLCGEPPFQGETEEEIFANIKKGHIDFSKKEFKNVSESCIDLIKKLLEPNKKNRKTAAEALKHDFFVKNFNPMKALTKNKDLNLLNRFITLKKLPSKLHEVVNAYCCFNYISKEEEKQLRELFRFLDRGNKNKLSSEDFKEGFKQANIMVSKYELKKIMNILDSDGSDSIEYQEFLRAICDKKLLFREENLRAVFGVIDNNKKGYATPDDIQKVVLGNDKKIRNRSTIKGCSAQIGMKKNSKLTFEQFSEIIRNNTCLQNNDDSSDSEASEEDEDVFKRRNNKHFTSYNIVEKVEKDRMMYNMTEGDEIVNPHNYNGLHRINTTKA